MIDVPKWFVFLGFVAIIYMIADILYWFGS